jgi:hypothetical protein
MASPTPFVGDRRSHFGRLDQGKTQLNARQSNLGKQARRYEQNATWQTEWSLLTISLMDQSWRARPAVRHYCILEEALPRPQAALP